jgi:large subunit ribosomal protein L4e
MAKVVSLENREVGNIELPSTFNEDINRGLLKRAYLAEESKKFQLKYTDPLAGKRKASELTKRRRSFKTTYGHTMNRSPRKTLSHRGTSFSYVGATAPHTVGGREAHPPKAEKILVKSINKKERQLAIRMGIAGSGKKDLVEKFHAVQNLNDFPLIVEDNINDISKTKDALRVLSSLGLEKELTRISERRIRAGKGKLRGRRYKRKLGPILVTTNDSKLKRAAKNLNVNVKNVGSLSVSDVSHAGKPGRLVVWTKSAVEALK